MSADDFEKRFQRHVEFMLEQQAKFDARQAQFDERQAQLIDRQAQFDERQVQFDQRQAKIEQVQAKTTDNLQLLTGKVLELTDTVASLSNEVSSLSDGLSSLGDKVSLLTDAVASTQLHLDSAVDEMRDGFNKLIATNELTNSLIEKLTLLEVQNSRRLNAVEQRVDNIEEKDSL